ncbi:MAG: AgrD family cyclic lactone autoinducer peptide [Oscillospiraceae bacterium]
MTLRVTGSKKAVAAVAKMATSVNVNSTCAFVVHQPKLPGNAKKLRKF